MTYDSILEKAYSNYSTEFDKDNSVGLTLLVARTEGESSYRKPTIEMFEGLIEAVKTFSERWNVLIEDRQMTWEESTKWVMQNINVE